MATALYGEGQKGLCTNARRVSASVGHGVDRCFTQENKDLDFCIQVLDLFLVRPAGIEPAAYSLGGCRSIRLSYERKEGILREQALEGVRGFCQAGENSGRCSYGGPSL